MANKQCIDTVKIVYNGDFPKNTTIQYSVGGATPTTTGVKGVGGELQNLANLVSFATTGTSPDTVSLELVFDISGSMDLPAVPSGTIKRIQALKDSAQTLFSILNAYALPTDPTIPLPGDKLGAVFFSNAANPDATPDVTPTSPCSGLPATNLLNAGDPANVGTIASLVNAQNPTFSTSIGAGLQSADCGFLREVTPQNTHKEILLFSDGEQNTPPNVKVVGTTVQVSDTTGANFANYPSNSAALCTAGQAPCIRICPVTAGRLTAPGFTLQESIATAVCGGNNAHIRDADPANPDPTLRDPQTFVQADLETYFAQSLTTIVTSDKLEMVADTIGTVSRGSISIEKFLGAANDVGLTMVLSWSGGSDNDRTLPLQVIAPDGTAIDLTPHTTAGRGVSFTNILFPLFQSGAKIVQTGEWHVAINGHLIHSPSVRYHLLVMADNPTLASEFTINAQDIGTKEHIPIQVKLIDDGAPVLNATVEAQLMGPSNSQGNVLSNTPTPKGSNSGADPASTKGQAKLNALYADPANASLFADKGLPTLTLVDGGNTGVYTGSFKGTLNEGHYYFTVRVRGKSATAGDFQRTYWIARFVRSKPDPNQTAFKLLAYDVQANGSVLVTLQAIPHDSPGNFLGPGYEKDMQISSSIGSVEKALDDKLDGSYEITYRLPSKSSNPQFTIQVMNTHVKTKTLRQLQNADRFAAFFDAGAAVPHGNFSSAFNTGFSLNIGLEYIATNQFSVEGIFGYHRFPGVGSSDLSLYQFSVNGKSYFTSGTMRPFVNGGVGGYKFNPGPTRFGGNVGAGLLYNVTSKVGLQGSYNFHMISTPGGATKFSTLQGGIRFVLF
jgi:hypothetical protein